MIHGITRHAAQTIWHDAMQEGHSGQGLLFSVERCIVAGTALLPEQSAYDALQQASYHASWRVCGFFYTRLPSVDALMQQDQALRPMMASDPIHLHLDLDAAGLLKMAAYKLDNMQLSTVYLTMDVN